MENNSTDLIADSFSNESTTPRNKLLPLWIKIFAWIFVVFGFLIPFIFIWGLITHNFGVSIYGLKSHTPYSFSGIIIVALFVFKAVVAIALLQYKDFGVQLAIIDAVLGIGVCVVVMIVWITRSSFTFRLELVALIPYLIKLRKIRYDWAMTAEQ